MQKNKISLAFVGDIMCQLEQTIALDSSHQSYEEVFKGVRPIFENVDYVLGNLETPVGGVELKYTRDAAVFNTPKAFAVAVKSAGIDFVSTANNHCLDRGVIGLDRTITSLDDVGLDHTGTYQNNEESGRIFIKEFDGFKIAVVASTYGTNSESGTDLLKAGEEWRVDLSRTQNRPNKTFRHRFRHAIGLLVPNFLKSVICTLVASLSGKTIQPPDYIVDNSSSHLFPKDIERQDLLLGKITTAKKSADFVIVMPHAGGQYNPGPGSYHKNLIRKCIEAGADLIVSGHSHTPLRTEIVEGRVLVAYSLGNFTFMPRAGWYIGNTLSDYGVVLYVDIDIDSAKICKASFSVVRSVTGSDGVSRVVPVDRYWKCCEDALERERIEMENEVIVNRVRGSSETVLPSDRYFINYC